MDKKILIQEIEQIPEPFLDEVYVFISYLKARIMKERMETALISKTALKKDWLTPQEDKAWQNL